MGRIHRYAGTSLTVTFDGARCIHAAECVRGLPDVFDTHRTPWVRPDEASAEAVRQVVARCPTGALKVEGAAEQAKANEARLQPGGPIYCRGRLRLLDGEGGVVLEDVRMALCRCGASANKPFCDNRHRASGFADPGAVADQEVVEKPGEGGLDLQPLPDGPLQVTGPLLLRDAAGKVRYAGAETWLCRCGASGTKPFCDGSHRAAGFRG